MMSLRKRREKFNQILYACCCIFEWIWMSCEITHKRPGSEFGAINKGEKEWKGNFYPSSSSFSLSFGHFKMLCIFMLVLFLVFWCVALWVGKLQHWIIDYPFMPMKLLCIVVIVPFNITQKKKKKSSRNFISFLEKFSWKFNIWLSQLLAWQSWKTKGIECKGFIWMHKKFEDLSIIPWLNL